MLTDARPRRPDGRRMIATLRERGAPLGNERHRAMVDVVVQHMECEVFDFDLEKLMGTLVEDPVYYRRGGMFASRETIVTRGRDTIRAMYSVLMDQGFPEFEIEVDRFIVDDQAVYFDGLMTMLWPGAMLESYGMSVDDRAGTYLETVWTGHLLPFRDDLISGEHLCYGPSNLTKLDA